MMNGTILPFLSDTIVQITYNHGIFVHECAMQFEFDSEFDSVFDSDFDGRIKKMRCYQRHWLGLHKT